jgi:hypothetical protein
VCRRYLDEVVRDRLFAPAPESLMSPRTFGSGMEPGRIFMVDGGRGSCDSHYRVM